MTEADKDAAKGVVFIGCGALLFLTGVMSVSVLSVLGFILGCAWIIKTFFMG